MEEDDDSEEKPSLCSRIPQRYIITAVLCFAMSYDVSVRSLYNVQMEYLGVTNESKHSKSIICDSLEKTTKEEEPKFEQYNWSKKSKKDFYQFYFLTYAILQPVVGYLSDRFVKLPRILMAVGLLTTTLFTFLGHTMISGSKNNVWILKIARLVLGAGQSVQFPVMNTIMSHWVPSNQRAFLCGAVYAAIFLGVALKYAFGAFITQQSGQWYVSSYMAGGVGVIVLYVWYRYGYGDPYLSPHITKTERRYLDAMMGDSIIRRNKPVPVIDLLTDLNVWFLIMCAWGQAYYWFSVETSINSFFEKAYLSSHKETRHWTIVPYVARSAFTLLFGFLSDWLVNRSIVDLVTLRKFFTSLGTIGPPIYVIAATYVGCNEQLAHVFVTISLVLQGTVFVGIRLLPLDLAPDYSGFIKGCMGITNSVGIFLPIIHEAIVTEENLEAYRRVFILLMGVSAFANLWIIPLGHVKMTSLGTDAGKFYKNN